MQDEFLWVEKWRPKKVEDAILPKELYTTFQKFVDNKSIPNLILAGGPGVGKTTIARAMLDQLDCDYIIINGSLSGNIDTLRNDIMQFASSVSLSGGRKYVILDEADAMTYDAQKILAEKAFEKIPGKKIHVLSRGLAQRLPVSLQRAQF